ncbi:hypothetical protein CDL12_14132 [Handroanthus impetiginosus]|uniref:Homeobox domain-containing protein n=1 Tax=Handroanthus impetiginosus TaxID=429701 RepID=A0A2G9H6V6_9LAMI|nr:hypothetical protein CDL12_14132 [Handroanthus impetiginosus]
MDNFACEEMANRVTVAGANSNEFCTIEPEGDATGFSTGTLYPQISIVQDTDWIMQRIPLPAERHISSENQEKLTTSGRFAYPSENTKTAVNNGYESLVFDTSATWDFDKWMMTEERCLNSNSTRSSRSSNGNSFEEQCSEMGSSGMTSCTLLDQHIVSEHASCSSSNNVSLSFDSYKPFLLPSGSTFVLAMQEILAEIACYALENTDCMSYSGLNASFSSNSIAAKCHPAIDFSKGVDRDCSFLFHDNVLQEREIEVKKKHLLALLQLVDNRYNQCLAEIHTKTSAFHAITELDRDLHAKFALPTISFMYKNLRARISSHILALGSHLKEREVREGKSFDTRFVEKQWAHTRDHQLWKPQRGLPERSVSVLRAWMFQNFLHPYPKDAEKHLLALKSGLTRDQVSNWFVNARVRLWKPMIEAMYAEMNTRKTRRNNDEQTEGNRRNQMRFENTRFTRE